MKQVDQEFPCVLVHRNCRREFTNPLGMSSSSMQTNEIDESLNLSVRSEDTNEFYWKKHCFLCGEFIVTDKKASNSTRKFFKAVELSSIDKIFSKCRERRDTCSGEICRTISLSIGLVAGDAIYHQQL